MALQRGLKTHVAAMREHVIWKSKQHLGTAVLDVVFDP